MKIHIPSNQSYTPKRRIIEPVIGLDRPKPKNLEKGQYVTIKCRTEPGNASSPTYDIHVPIFKTGTAEDYLNWRKNLGKAIIGQNCTTAQSTFAMARRLLDGDALAAFDTTALTLEGETAEGFQHLINELTVHVFPDKAAQQQKRYMRRALRKPVGMPVKELVTRVVEMNELLPFFPPHPNSN